MSDDQPDWLQHLSVVSLAPGDVLIFRFPYRLSERARGVVRAQVREVFGENVPPLSSTKALSGHSLGAASVHEAIYCLLMMQGGFVAGSANIASLDPRAEGFPIVRQSRDAQLDTVMSNSFGFGGTNGTLVLARCRD